MIQMKIVLGKDLRMGMCKSTVEGVVSIKGSSEEDAYERK